MIERSSKRFDTVEPEQLKRISIRDVAREAGVAISTVSLVMNGKTNVADETRVRVMEAAERLGYQPSRQARRLVQRDTGNVGFVLREDHFTRSEPFYTGIFLGVEFEARRQNRYVLLTTIPEVYRPAYDQPRFLREHNVDGVLVAGKVDGAFLDALTVLGLPAVLVDYSAPGFACVEIDNEGAGRAMAAHFLQRGYRRPSFVGADPSHPSIQARLAGFRRGLAEGGLSLDPSHVFLSEEAPTRATGMGLGHDLLGHPAAPDAVFCANDALALGLLETARAQGVSVPEDLAVAGFDDVQNAAECVPPLTTIRVFKEYLGEIALLHLSGLITARREAHARTPVPSAMRVATELIVRASA